MKLGHKGQGTGSVVPLYIYYIGQGSCQPVGLRDNLLNFMIKVSKTKGHWDSIGLRASTPMTGINSRIRNSGNAELRSSFTGTEEMGRSQCVYTYLLMLFHESKYIFNLQYDTILM